MYISDVKRAEYILQTNNFDKLSKALSLIIRYFIQIKDYNPLLIKEEARKFLALNNEEFEYWENTVDKIIKSAKKYPLYDIDSIPITQSEIDVIRQAGNSKKQKILFTFLVMGKLQYLKTGKAWVNDTGAKIFKLANAQTKTEERDYIIRDFYEAGFISYAKSPMNMSIHIDFIDDTGDAILTITDLRNLGYQWLKYSGRNYIPCKECGILFKPTNTNNLYCNEHKGYIRKPDKVIVCCDCNNKYIAPAMARGNRCPLCSRIRRNEKQKELMRKRKQN